MKKQPTSKQNKQNQTKKTPSDNKAKGKIWSNVFSKPTNAHMQLFHSSLPFDYQLYLEDIRGSIAHTHALKNAKILFPAEQQKLEKALLQIKNEITISLKTGKNKQLKPILPMGEPTVPEEDDIHMWIEKQLIEKVGSLGQKLHTARSRNDQVATDMRLYLRSAITQLRNALLCLMTNLHKSAGKHLLTVMPGHTHLQAAQPISFSFFLMAYFFMFSRDAARLQNCLNLMNFSPLGSGAFAGVNYKVDRTIAAKKMNFAGITENAMDSVASRDGLAEYLSCLSIIITNLSRLAEDFILFCNPNFGFITMDDAYSSGSSIMPNKKNPDLAELIRGKAGRVIGSHISLLMVLKGLPMAYNRDLQEDKEGTFDATQTIDACLHLSAAMVSTLTVNKKAMRAACEKGFIAATDVADYLVKKGMPFRKAHGIAASLVKTALDQNTTLEKLPLSTYTQASNLFTEDIFLFISMENILQRKESAGSCAPKEVAKQLKIAQKILTQLKASITKSSKLFKNS